MTSGFDGHNGYRFEPELTEIYRHGITAFADAIGEDPPTGGEPVPDRPHRQDTLCLNWDPHGS